MNVVLILLTLITLIEQTSLYLFKKYELTGKTVYYIIGVIGYVIITALLVKSFEYAKIGIVNHSWNVASSICGFLIGYWFFSEKLTPMEIVGVFISVIGIIIMNYK